MTSEAGITITFKDGRKESVDPIRGIYFDNGKLVVNNGGYDYDHTFSEIKSIEIYEVTP